MGENAELYHWLTLITVSPWLYLLCRSDWKSRRLPNGMTLGGLAVVLIFRLGFGLSCFLNGLWGMLVCGGFLLLPVLFHAAGAGDLKMISACGAVIGLPQCLDFLMAMALSGLVLVIIMLVMKAADGARLKHYARSLFDWRYDRKAGKAALPPKDSERTRVPFGIAIAAGLWIVLGMNCIGGLF